MDDTDIKINNLFPSSIIMKKCNFDLKKFSNVCKLFEKNVQTKNISNRYGYQGHNFKDIELETLILDIISKSSEKKIKNYKSHFWVNINYKNSFNVKHNHIFRGSFLSGVFYVKVPKNSGNLIFFDPRNIAILCSEDFIHYNVPTYFEHVPEENQLLIFPSWLEHEVTLNNSDEERISIAFNIYDVSE